MLKKISRYFFNKPDEIGFNNYMVLVLSFFSASMGILGTLINIILGLGLFTIISTLIPTIIFTPIYIYSWTQRKYMMSKYIIMILMLVLLNFQWFINYGSYGPILYLFIVIESFIIIFFKRWTKLIFTLAVFLNVTILFIIEYLEPGIFGRYKDESTRLLDLYFGALIDLFISIILLNLALKFYRKQKEKAEESDKLKSAFLANMSHEIRTPMNGILGFSELLKKPNLTGEEQQTYINIIQKSGERMLNLINNLVDISKIESGLMEVHYQAININEVLEYNYNFFKPQLDAKGIELKFETGLTYPFCMVRTDREKVYAILLNLVKNAYNYTDQGSIRFGYKKKGDLLEFFVCDTGTGIAAGRQDVIFERFIQADITDKMARQGAGLGLSIIKSHVELLGGKIWLESKLGMGSNFYFTIPYQQIQNKDIPVPVNETHDIAQTDTAKDNLVVLIAEDDKYSEILIETSLQDLCKEVIKVTNGKDAVEACRNRPDIGIIFMDIKMPLMDGYEATRQIRTFNMNVAIIAQTAYGLTGDRDKAISAGCNDYIAKPINRSKLITLVNRYKNI
ncbi:MAG: response regulator [Bacteroidetes bacterium]|nr:response regulator [Bacteroidota bacterium]